MGKINWDQVETILDEALELPKDECFEYIEKRCAHSKELKGEVTRLLNSIFDSEGWLEGLKDSKYDFYEEISADVKSLAANHSFIGQQVGAYTIEEQIGEGGMGLVYLAERSDQTFEHKVAIKIIRHSHATEENIRRFKREQRILAGLNHPGIAKLFDGGVTDDGHPYIIMEYVDGIPIDRYCREKNISLISKINLFKQVLDAVRHAHENLVIHRDLKPGNILVDENGQVKILDFGISKLLEEEEDPNLTQTGDRLLTPRYAAPEQIKETNITTASDLYSLGVVFYELISGASPFDLKDVSRYKAEQVILKQQPPKPSSQISSPTLSRQVKGDLDAIALKAIRKEPRERYRLSNEFIDDLNRYLQGLPVSAQKTSFKYRTRKFFARHKQGVTVSVVIVFLIFAFAGFYTLRITEERNQAQMEARKAETVKHFLENMITAGNTWTNPDEPQTARDLIEQGAQTVEEVLADQPALSAEILGIIGASYQGMREDSLARHYLSRAISLIETGAELDELTVAGINAEYAGSLLRSGQPKEAEALAQQTLNDLNEEIEAREERSQLLRMLANAQNLLGESSAAVASAEEAADLVCNIPNQYVQQCINAKMTLRHFYEWVGEYEAGLKAAEFAYLLADSAKAVISEPLRLAAVGNYGNTLSYNAQSTKAIPLLKKNVDRALKAYGEDSYRYVLALHDLVSAYQYAGRAHDALPRAEKVFRIGGTAQTGNPRNSYWLHRIVHLALDLRMPNRAEAVYTKYEDELPDQMSNYFINAFDTEHLRLQSLRNPGSKQIREQIEALLERLRKKNSRHLADVVLLAAEQAVEAKDSDAAQKFLKEFNTRVGAVPPHDIRPARAKLLNARRLILLGKPDQAMEEAKQSLELLQEIGHEDSPFIAKSKAVLAELHCQQGNPADGQALLDESLDYWREIAEVPAGVTAMEQLVPSCHQAAISE